MIHELRFSLQEVLSLIGVFQSVYILVYIFFRFDRFRYAAVPVSYFSVLGLAFFLDASQRFLGDISAYYSLFGIIVWFLTLHVSVLLILQMAKGVFPGYRLYGALLLLPGAAALSALYFSGFTPHCFDMKDNKAICPEFSSWLVLCNLIAAGFSMLLLWSKKDVLKDVHTLKVGRERYWLILTIIINNLFFLALMFAYFDKSIPDIDIVRIRTVLGLAFLYLATTAVFRVFPQSIWRAGVVSGDTASFSEQEKELMERIKSLLTYEKVYQEPGFGRADLARELGVPETQISHVINQGFGKSLPQLLNEYRVEEARQLLRETNAPITVIAEETGFSSIATFNRVFKEIAGCSPSADRKKSLNP